MASLSNSPVFHRDNPFDMQALSPQLDLTTVHAYREEQNLAKVDPYERPTTMTSDTISSEDEDTLEKVYFPSRLLALPNEILSLILDFLDTPPPSHTEFHRRPDTELTVSGVHPLKSTSGICKRLRVLASPLLFRHARLDPYHLTPFLSFLSTSNLTSHVTTLTATLQGPCSHFHPAWWARLLNTIPHLQTLTVTAAPHVFAELAHLAIDDSHSWAFNMPQHTLVLSVTQPHLHARLELPSPTPPLLLPTQPRIPYNDVPNLTLLNARPWTSLKYNEGSSLTAYATYEYYLKKTPCLISSLPILSSPVSVPVTPSPSVGTVNDTGPFLRNLRSFSFTAIFPFYNHVDEILKRVRQMVRLHHLFIKLCPEPESTVLEDEIKATNGHIDVNDPWNEFETSYSLITHTVNYLTLEGQLSKFEVDDVKMAGIRDSLEDKITGHLLLDQWRYRGGGIWYRCRVNNDSS